MNPAPRSHAVFPKEQKQISIQVRNAVSEGMSRVGKCLAWEHHSVLEKSLEFYSETFASFPHVNQPQTSWKRQHWKSHPVINFH